MGREPGLRAAIAYPRQRADIRADRSRSGLLVGGGMLLKTAAHDHGVRPVASEGAGSRSAGEQKHMPDAPLEPLRWTPRSRWRRRPACCPTTCPRQITADLMPRIAPRRVLLIGDMHGNPDDALNRVYRDAGGPTVALGEIRASARPAASPPLRQSTNAR
jgi:hypothetical protein